MFRRSILVLVAACSCLSLARADEPKLDLNTWRHLPVFRGGRTMPLDTFSRVAVEIICDRPNPTLEFGGERRKFDSSELLMSWLTEPEKWQDVPFLIAEHDELRQKLLGVDVTAADGTHLKYVSPATVAASDDFLRHIDEMRDRARAARMDGETPQESILDKRAKELFDAYTMFQQLTFDPRSAPARRMRFMQVGTDVLKNWTRLDQDLRIASAFVSLDETGDRDGANKFRETVSRVDGALRSMAKAAGAGEFSIEAVEPDVVIASENLQVLADQCADLKARKFEIKDGQIPGMSAEQVKDARATLQNRLSASMKLLARQAKELHIALYENSMDENRDALRVVPALNAAALDRDRDTEDASQPWLTLQTVLFGSPELLADYPQPQIKAVRATFGRLAQAYTNRKASNRPQAIADAETEFAAAIRALGEKTTAERSQLKIANRDEDLLRYTAYPATGATDVEVKYNRTDPFKWSWVIGLAALFSFCLAFGAARKPLFWVGTLVLLLGLAWTVYGFSLRVMITKWAPVTNMYETVVYVPFFVSLLGAWFLLLPITWPGLQKAWKLTAIPGTWEAKSDEDDALPLSQFSLLNLLLIVGRLGLMVLTFQILTVKPYAAGGRTIINLKPMMDEGASLPNLNNLVVWLVGLCVLLPAVWYLPRVMVALCVSLFTILKTIAERGSELIEQVYERKPFGLAATFAAFFGAFIAWYSPVLDKNFTPLQPVLRDNFWLTIHVLTIVSSYGAGMLAWGLGNLSLGYYLLGKYRTPETLSTIKPLAAGFRPASRTELTVEDSGAPGKLPPEACHSLAGFIYKTIQVAVLLLAAGTILGGLWADVSWGRFWGWDPKEVWALISLLVYLAILHGRYAGWFGDFGLAVGSVLGASAIVFSWYGVNFYLGVGLHSYGFGAGGQLEVLSGVVLNWLFLGAAAIRYKIESRESPPPTKDGHVAEPTDAEHRPEPAAR